MISPLRWTPPMPPVAKTSMPASFARIIVPATVVPPSLFMLITIGRSLRHVTRSALPCARANGGGETRGDVHRRETLRTLALLAGSERRSSSEGDRPMVGLPPITPMTAWTAPSRRMMAWQPGTLSRASRASKGGQGARAGRTCRSFVTSLLRG